MLKLIIHRRLCPKPMFFRQFSSETGKNNHILKKLGNMSKNKKSIFDEIDIGAENLDKRKGTPRRMSRKTNAFKFLKKDLHPFEDETKTLDKQFDQINKKFEKSLKS